MHVKLALHAGAVAISDLTPMESEPMTNPHTPDDPESSTFRTARMLPYPPSAIFAAFARPEVLARWWGPAGFTNTFEVFEFTPGGRWKYDMHGPKGARYPNESVFVELDAPSKVVIHHVAKPRYLLTVTMEPRDGGTAVTWNQEFEESAVAARIRHIVTPANEENLDKLTVVLGGGTP
jgi:uncharacterized protein YndB with AHSA1/START domain